MLLLLYSLIPFILIYIVYEITKDKLSTKHQIFILLLICLLFYNSDNIKEYFTTQYLDELKTNNDNTNEFCKRLSLLDKPSENTILLKKFRDTAIRKNKEEIRKLRTEIDKYYLDNINDDIYKKNSYKLWRHNQAQKQLDVINKGQENLHKKNSIQINLN